MRPTLTGLAACLLVPAGLALADPAADAGDGSYLAQGCVACHWSKGGDGIPSLDGLPVEDFTEAMLAYQSGERPDELMQVMAKPLGADEIAALAAYFAGQGQ